MTDFQRYILRLLADGWHIQDEPGAGDVRYDLRGIVAPVEEVQPLIEQGYIAKQGQEGATSCMGLQPMGARRSVEGRARWQAKAGVFKDSRAPMRYKPSLIPGRKCVG